ncbi:MAG: TetR/AcrR family transcriptional regulator [Actinobacteria bacterium]|nr:TetR/AcrR family transcriptional regulator [Actinomycetota bacterium]
MAPLTRERRKQLTRDHLLASAEHLFLERGFHASSIDDIARAAGFTKGAVYAHFSNKEDVFIALTERRWDEHLARVRNALDTLATPSGDRRSASFVELTRDLLWDDPDWSLLALEFNVYAARNPSAQHRFSERHRVRQSLLATLLARDLAQRGVDPPIAPNALAGVLLAFFNGIALKHTTNPDQGDNEVLAAAIQLIEVALEDTGGRERM